MAKPVSSIPEGFHSITPHLMVEGAAAYMDFLTRAFGAVELQRSPGPGGKLMHVRARIGDSMLMFADDFCQEFHMQPFVRGKLPIVLNLYVQDADASWAQALAAGCTAEMPLQDQFWGDRYGHVRDPFGFVWAISQHKEDPTPQELQERAAKAFARGS